MESNIRKKIIINVALDSSEAFMFSRGAMQNIILDNLDLYIDKITELEITFEIKQEDFEKFNKLIYKEKKLTEEVYET